MKKFLGILLVLLIFSLTSEAQYKNNISIKGRVVDINTKEPLVNTNIFLVNTTIGTTSNNNGEFFINNIPYGFYRIIFSYVGYKTEIRNIDLYGHHTIEFEISLQPKSISLKQVDITASFPEDWEKNLEIFNRIFIGETANSRHTKILNPEVLNFEKNEETREFKAYSDSLLRIENKALGYILYIVLDSLVQIPSETRIIYAYYPRFEEMTPASDKEKEIWKENRQEAYLASPRHFYYSLVHKQLSENHFTLRKSSGFMIDPENLDLVCVKDSTIYEFKYHGQLEIDYGLNKKSKLTFFHPSVIIDKNGNLLSHFYSLEISGYWAKQRMADTLPNDYSYKSD